MLSFRNGQSQRSEIFSFEAVVVSIQRSMMHHGSFIGHYTRHTFIPTAHCLPFGPLARSLARPPVFLLSSVRTTPFLIDILFGYLFENLLTF